MREEVSIFELVDTETSDKIIQALKECYGEGNYEIIADSILIEAKE